MATGIRLVEIEQKQIAVGGYKIGYKLIGELSQNLSQNYSIRLFVHRTTCCESDNGIDITCQKDKSNVLTKELLPTFLGCIDKLKLWADMKNDRTAYCSICVMNGTEVIARSNSKPFPCPLEPYKGRLKPEMGKGPPEMRYCRKTCIHIPSIRVNNQDCFFIEKAAPRVMGQFETRRKFCGLDCITYAGAVFGVCRNSRAMGRYGTDLAIHLGAHNVNLENKTGKQIRDYFSKHLNETCGTYLMWSERHVVIVVGHTVHEFSIHGGYCEHGGYRAMSIWGWRFRDVRYWVRALPYCRQLVHRGPLQFPPMLIVSKNSAAE